MKELLTGVIKQLWHALMIGAGVIFTIDAIDMYKVDKDNGFDL